MILVMWHMEIMSLPFQGLVSLKSAKINKEREEKGEGMRVAFPDPSTFYTKEPVVVVR